MSRGILYLVWPGDARVESVLKRSIESARHWHPELPRHVVMMPEGSDLRCKAQMADLSPFDETLFLDADTVVMGRLDYGFTQAERHGMALSICCNPWARRYESLSEAGDLVEYNTGVIFFDKRDNGVNNFFRAWKSCATMDSNSYFITAAGLSQMTVNDQCSFAVAMDSQGDYCGFNPFVLPSNWNHPPRWHKTFFGPVKIWHDYADPPAMLAKWNEGQSKPYGIILRAEIP